MFQNRLTRLSESQAPDGLRYDGSIIHPPARELWGRCSWCSLSEKMRIAKRQKPDH